MGTIDEITFFYMPLHKGSIIYICVGERYIYKGIVSSGKFKKNPIHNGLRVPYYFSHTFIYTHMYILYIYAHNKFARWQCKVYIRSLPTASNWYIWV